MTRHFRIFLGLVGVVLLSVPLRILATILLLPFWSRFEASTGIESVGHSGPAEWCYALLFLLLAASLVLLSLVKKRGR